MRAVCASSWMWTAGSAGRRPAFVLLVQGSLYARFEHAGVLAEVAKLPEHVGRSLATELWILSGQIRAPARHVILRGGRNARRSSKPTLSYQTLPTLLKCDDGVTFEERKYCVEVAKPRRDTCRGRDHLPAQMHAHYRVHANVQLPADSRLNAEHKPLSDEPPDTATCGKCALAGREGFIVEKRLACLKQPGADNDKRCDQLRGAIHGSDKVQHHVTREHQMIVVVAPDVRDLRSQADSRQYIDTDGSPDKAFRHDPVVGEKQRAGRELRRRSGTFLGCRRTPQGRDDEDRRENDHADCRPHRIRFRTSQIQWANQVAPSAVKHLSWSSG